MATANDTNDVLAEINGIKPKRYLAAGDECEAKSQTRLDCLLYVQAVSLILRSISDAVYKIKRTGDHYYWCVETHSSQYPPCSED